MNATGIYIANKKNTLSIYFTAEYPEKGCTNDIILSLQEAGADLLEIGIPFSDPLADGPVIQASSSKALENGFTVDGLFNNLHRIRPQVKIPLVLMGYFNTVLAYGIEKFLSQCRSLQIDTLILPDLPPGIYEERYAAVFAQHGVSPVFLVTPQTGAERMEKISRLSKAFIYAVADNSITGATGAFSEKQLLYFERIQESHFKVPVMIGFGISTHDAYSEACKYSQGVIIGSAFIRSLASAGTLHENIHQFIHSIKQSGL